MVEEVIESLIALAALFAWVGIVISLIQLYQLGAALRVPGAGRIFYLADVSLKLWAAGYLGWVVIAATFQPWDRTARLVVNLGFAVYLVVQSLIVNIALWRWRKK